jgi:hypothetical protein
MRTTGVFLAFMLFGGVALAQRSVIIDDLTSNEVKAAIAAGKTTLVFYVGGTQENEYVPETEFNGPTKDAVVLGKHNIVANYVARRIAETLGNALAYSAFPHAPMGQPLTGGTVGLTEETYAAVLRDVVNSAVSAGFKVIVLETDHGGGKNILKKVAEDSDRRLSAKGVRVYNFNVYDKAKEQMIEHISSLKGAPELCRTADKLTRCHTIVDDAAEVLFLDKENRWVRKDKIAPVLATLVTPELGRVLIEQKVTIAVTHIRNAVASAQR